MCVCVCEISCWFGKLSAENAYTIDFMIMYKITTFQTNVKASQSECDHGVAWHTWKNCFFSGTQEIDLEEYVYVCVYVFILKLWK